MAKSATVSGPPFQYFGGKWEMADWIISHFPEHQTYVEGFGGAAGVLLRKPPSAVEVYNDLDEDLANFWRMVREQPADLASLILFTPYARREYERCKDGVAEGGELERARRYATVARQSMSGAWGRAWSSVIGHSRRGMASGNSRWLRLPESILECCDRLASVQVESMPAPKLIKRYGKPETLFYLDPEYHPDTCQTGVYRCGMTLDDHRLLLDAILASPAKFVVSNYHNPMYDEALSGDGWRVVEREVSCRSNIHSNGSIAGRPKRTEVLWIKGGGA